MRLCDTCGRRINPLRDATVRSWAPPAGFRHGLTWPQTPREALDLGFARITRCTTCAPNPAPTADEIFSQRRRRWRGKDHDA